MLKIAHQPTADRFLKIIPLLKKLGGPDNFQLRIDKFDQYWSEWYDLTQCMWFGAHGARCSCNHMSFDKYCDDFDKVYDPVDKEPALLLTRKMMYVMISCNKYYGMDGMIYDVNGKQVGKEYMAINSLTSVRNDAGMPAILIKYLSEFERFRI